MPISRTYLCDDCDMQFSRLHWDRAEPVPDCPFCESAKAKQIPGSFNIGTVKGKAVDLAYKIAEEDFGMTNMHDNLREGDIAAVAPPPIQTSEAEAIVHQMKDALGDAVGTPDHLLPQVQSFWKNNATPPAPPEAAALRSTLEATAVANAGAARLDGADPIELLHKGAKASGGSGMDLRVMSRAKMN